MRNLVVVAVTAALLTVVSGCARQVYYYSPYPNDSYYPDNSYSSDPDYSEPDPEPYGGSYRTAIVRATATMVAHTGLATPNIPQGHPAFVGNPAAVGFHATPQGHDQKVTAVGHARCSLFVRTI